MTKLESYQKGASFAATTFYADIEGAPGDPPSTGRWKSWLPLQGTVRVLGTYPQARRAGSVSVTGTGTCSRACSVPPLQP
jgi:prephenate dehydratase